MEEPGDVGEDLAYCVVKTVKSEVIAMWAQWVKELKAGRKKKGTISAFSYFSFSNA